jgi:DUF2937 family protein
MGFIRRWLSRTLSLGLGLALALLAMQAPAVTHDYAVALLQVARDLRRDADERIASARQFYALAAASESDLIEALRRVEPSNAQTLAASLQRAGRLQADYDAIAAAAPLAQPLVALWQALREDAGDQAILRRTLFETYNPQISLTAAAAVYGLGGLLLGTLLAEMLLAAFSGAVRLWARRTTAGRYAR